MPRSESPSGVGTRRQRRHAEAAPDAWAAQSPPAQVPAPVAPGHPDIDVPARRELQRAPGSGTGSLARTGTRGDALRAGVERWSRWAAGLGLPPRDARGVRRFPGRESVVPPAVWVTAALAVAAVAGLLGGLLLSTGSGAGTVSTAVATTTVKVTNETTAPPVTTTRTLTRTRTVTLSPTAPAPTDGGAGGAAGAVAGGLAPGAQGPQVVALQQALTRLGLYQGGPTGTYDQQTQAAVQAFQQRTGIADDPPGVAGPTTLRAIFQAVGA